MQTSYFPHDSNARNSDKLLPVRMKYGAEGYGIYFMLLERLRDEPTYMSIKDYNALAFDLRVDAQKIKSIIEDFGLFSFTDDGKCFYSEGFMKRMEIKDSKTKARSKAGKKGAEKRWNEQKNSNAIAKPLNEDNKAITMPYQNDSKESKVNKSKVNKSNKNNSPKSKKRTYEPDDINFKLANDLWNKIKNNNPETKEPNLQNWSNDIRLMHERDNRDYDKIQRMIDWCQSDTFWVSNILSAGKLRAKYDTMNAQVNRKASKSKPKVIEHITDWEKQAKITDSRSDEEKRRKAKELKERVRKMRAEQP